MEVRRVAEREKISPQEAFEKGAAWADKMLDACSTAGMVAVIGVMHFPLDPKISVDVNSREFWENAKYVDEIVALSGSLANRFKNRGKELAGYDIMSEPLLREGRRAVPPPGWRDVLDRIVREVRKYDKKRWVVVAPGPAGGPAGYEDFSPLGDPYVIYGAHMYLPHPYTYQGIKDRKLGLSYPGTINGKYWDKEQLKRSLLPLVQFEKKYNVPIWIGEFSAAVWAPNSDQYLGDLVDVFNGFGWGWAYFCSKCYHGWDPDYDATFSTDNPSDWQKHYVGKETARWKFLKDAFLKSK